MTFSQPEFRDKQADRGNYLPILKYRKSKRGIIIGRLLGGPEDITMDKESVLNYSATNLLQLIKRLNMSNIPLMTGS